MGAIKPQFKSSRWAVLRVFLLVANIPYGGVGRRDTYLAAKANRASCSSKHQLLFEILTALGVPTRLMMGECELQDFGASLPKPITLDQSTRDYHNFLSVHLDGHWRRVDATFGQREAAVGLPTNLDWDAQSDCQLAFPVKRVWEIGDIISDKIAQVDRLPAQEVARRAAFFDRFTHWLEERSAG